MRVLLITPPEVLNRQEAKVRPGRIASAPLGIGYIGAVLEESGHDVGFVDFAAERITDIPNIIKRIGDYDPQVIGVSFMTITANQAFDLVTAIKNQFNVPVILGGPHPTYFPEDTLTRLPEADAVVIGEGEAVIPELIEALSGGRALDNIEGICYRDKSGRIKLNEPRKVIRQLDEIPPPARHLFNFSLYDPYTFQVKRAPVATMITSRGCPYAKCTFCYSSARKIIVPYRRHSVERIIAEIKSLIQRYGIREINFLDDDFAMGEGWVNGFCDALRQENIDITWICMARANSVSRELLLKMAKAGCWNIFFGIESANQHLLDRINKGITVDQNRNAVIWAHEAGMQVSAAFMMLLPGESPEDARRNVQFAKELEIEFVAFGPTRPLAGTPLFEQCRAFSKEEMPAEYYKRSGDYFIPYVTFIPEGYTKKEAMRVCRDAYREYYFRPGYIWQMLKRIKSFKDIERYITCVKLFLKLV